jgi:hypothetical protein
MIFLPIRNGQMKYQYEGENTRAAIVEFMRFPQPHKKQTTRHIPEDDWSLTDSKVVHLTSEYLSFEYLTGPLSLWYQWLRPRRPDEC